LAFYYSLQCDVAEYIIFGSLFAISVRARGHRVPWISKRQGEVL